MSARERKRYLTTAIVFALAFFLIGVLVFHSMFALAQSFTFKPTFVLVSTYGAGIPATKGEKLAFDANLATAADTYTNSDFTGDGTIPDTTFSQSAVWSLFNQSANFIRAVGLYVLRSGELNLAGQWTIEYSLNAGSTWQTLDNGSTPNPTPKSTVSTLTIPNDFDVKNDLYVRTTSKQRGDYTSTTSLLKIYDIRVEAEWNADTGGPEPLHIVTSSLPDGAQGYQYPPPNGGGVTIDAEGGKNTGSGYLWSVVGGALPTGLTLGSTGSPYYDGQLTGTTSTGGTYSFRVKVTDNSSPPQEAQSSFTIHVSGLSIYPPGPALTAAVKARSYSQQFDPLGGTSPYYWCYTGSIPPNMSLLLDGTSAVPEDASDPPSGNPSYEGSYVILSGTPSNDGFYTFTLKMTDSVGAEVARHTYNLEVRASGVTLQPRRLKDYIKGVAYGFGSTDIMIPEFIAATGIYNIGAAGDIYIPPTTSTVALPSPFSALSLNPGGVGSLPSNINGMYRTFITGTIPANNPSGTKSFTVGIRDPGNPIGSVDSETYQLRVLDRKTLLLVSPASVTQLPQNHQLQFSVFAQGGAPSNGVTDTALDGSSVPYYNYKWVVTPVGDAPALATSSGTTTPVNAAPVSVTIAFQQAGGAPVTGTYDISFWAQDYLTRANSTDPDYEFAPVTVRIKVIAPGGRTLERETGGKTKLRQEQFR